jgi:glycosyltransferase involved in cell wall biosynthesis
LILGQSRAFAERIEVWSDAPEKFRYFPNWVEEAFEHCDAARPAPEVAAHAGRFRILFAGNFGEAQDLPTVLAAAAQAKAVRNDLCWLLVGDGRAAPKVRQEIERLGLQDTVFLLGRHPLERMPSFFAGVEVLLVSLKDEPIFALTVPGKVQSYLAAGKPLLAMLNGEGARVVAESGAGFTAAAGKADELAAAAVRLAGAPQTELEAMAKAGKIYGEKHFSRRMVMDQLVTWLNPPGAR